MENIAHPADQPYTEGDRVRVYLAESDTDSQHHGKTGIVTDVLEDTLDQETERELDSYSYRIKVDEEELDIWFRHRDLVPVNN